MRQRSPLDSYWGLRGGWLLCVYLHGEVGGQTSHCDVSRGGPIGAVHLHLSDVAGGDPAAAALLVLVLRIVLFVLVV